MQTEKIRKSDKPMKGNLQGLIRILEVEYPDEDLEDPANLCRLLNREFGTEFVENDIYEHYSTLMEEEDNKLQYKNLGINV